MLVAEDLTKRIIGLAIEVQHHTGTGLLGSVYERCLCHDFEQAGMLFGRDPDHL